MTIKSNTSQSTTSVCRVLFRACVAVTSSSAAEVSSAERMRSDNRDERVRVAQCPLVRSTQGFVLNGRNTWHSNNCHKHLFVVSRASASHTSLMPPGLQLCGITPSFPFLNTTSLIPPPPSVLCFRPKRGLLRVSSQYLLGIVCVAFLQRLLLEFIVFPSKFVFISLKSYVHEERGKCKQTSWHPPPWGCCFRAGRLLLHVIATDFRQRPDDVPLFCECFVFMC